MFDMVPLLLTSMMINFDFQALDWAITNENFFKSWIGPLKRGKFQSLER